MANIKSAEKRMRQDAKRQQRNRSNRTRMRTHVKRLRAKIEEGDAEAARELLPTTLGVIDVTAQKGAIHRNVADRTKSRLARAVNALA